MDVEKIKKEAEEELNAELHRELVNFHKERLRKRRSFWIRLFPWRIKLERRDLPERSVKQQLDDLIREIENLGVRVQQQYGGIIVERTGGK